VAASGGWPPSFGSARFEDAVCRYRRSGAANSNRRLQIPFIGRSSYNALVRPKDLADQQASASASGPQRHRNGRNWFSGSVPVHLADGELRLGRLLVMRPAVARTIRQMGSACLATSRPQSADARNGGPHPKKRRSENETAQRRTARCARKRLTKSRQSGEQIELEVNSNLNTDSKCPEPAYSCA
jgi:hypothetical protein